MGIGVGGLISGMDTESIITQMMDIERRPILDLQQEEAFYQSKISAVGILKGGLAALQSKISPLTDAANFTSFSASSSDSTVLSVSTDGSATVAEYQVEVTQLAQNQQVRSAAFVDLTGTIGKDQVVGTGILTLQVGSGTAVDITIDASNNTLAGIATAINAAGTDVNAAVLDDGSGNYYLTLASKNSGSTNTIALTMTDDDGNNTDSLGLSSLYTDPLAGTLTETQAAANAKLIVNGIAVERASNTIDDLLDGLTITLNKQDPGIPLTVSVVDDVASVTSKIEAFVTAYNSITKSLASFQSYDPGTGDSGTLQGDSTARMIQNRLQGMLYTKVDGVADEVNGLSQLGIKIDKEGVMSLDSAVLTTAIKNNRQDVTNFFSQDVEGKKGFALQLDDLLTGYVSSNGLLAAKEDGLNASVKSDQDQIERINYRLVLKEETLRAQFQALETLLANFEKTSGVLSGQLNSLANLNSQIYKK